MNGTWAFLGGFAAVAAGIAILVLLVRNKLHRLSRQLFGTTQVLSALSEVQNQEAPPRSLNGCDCLVIPRILEDFPDFDPTLAKTYVREYLEKQLSSMHELQIHNIVFTRYLPSASQKTIVFQAAVSNRENGKTIQRRYDLHYTYLIATGDESVAANCPNCGGTLGYGDTVCPYCGSRVVNVMGNTWEFTELRES